MRTIPADQLMDVLQSAEHTLFRLELQPFYDAPGELEATKRFMTGNPIDPEDRPGSVAWRAQVADWVKAGVEIKRVRVQEDVPTPYQRWERWSGAFNIAAGEQLRYMNRTKAHQCGLLPAAGNLDWWLLDSNRVMQLHFDGQQRLTHLELHTDPSLVVQANSWRDLAVHHSALETVQGIAMQGIHREPNSPKAL